MKRLLKYSMLVFVPVVIGAVAFIGYELFSPVNIPEPERQFEIKEGQTVKQVTRELSERGLIKSSFWFRTYVWLKGAESKFIAGNLSLPAKVNTRELLGLITKGAWREVKNLTIPEGWTIRDIAIYLEYNGLWMQEELTELVGLPGVSDSLNGALYLELADKYPVLKLKKAGAPLEGYLFPDTYQIYANAKIGDLINKMLSNFERKVTPEMFSEIRRQGKNFYDVLIMASIIEAEVPHEQDRAVVADIFWSRLASGVALQSDATLKYVIGGKRPALTSEELKMDSPYNTYKYKGLPPTPIGNPGLSAIKAAIYPAKTDYFYFLSTPDGQTIFSRTLAEHNAAKARYLK